LIRKTTHACTPSQSKQRTTKETDAGSACPVVTGACSSSLIRDVLKLWWNPRGNHWMPLSGACKQLANTVRTAAMQKLNHQLFSRWVSLGNFFFHSRLIILIISHFIFPLTHPSFQPSFVPASLSLSLSLFLLPYTLHSSFYPARVLPLVPLSLPLTFFLQTSHPCIHLFFCPSFSLPRFLFGL